MSRFDGDGDDWDEGRQAMWDHNLRLALSGKRGQQALRDLKAALLALPEPRLISSALCTMERTDDEGKRAAENCGEGVCAVGAYAWYQRVKKGMDPQEAFASLPTVEASEFWWIDQQETVDIGVEAGLTKTLAWTMGWENDEGAWSLQSSEQRYEWFMRWVDSHLLAGATP